MPRQAVLDWISGDPSNRAVRVASITAQDFADTSLAAAILDRWGDLKNVRERLFSAFVTGGWSWVPGPVVVRPVWAPALVAFVGGGPGFHFSVGVGVGWFPLAPGEVFVPGYRVSRGYVNNVNITNTTVNVTKVTNVDNTVIVNKSTTVNNVTYVNQRVNNGVTVVSHDTFVNARPVARNVMRVDEKELVSAPISHMANAEPIRTSVVGAGRPVNVRPPAAVLSRPVVAVRTPPALPRYRHAWGWRVRSTAGGGWNLSSPTQGGE